MPAIPESEHIRRGRVVGVTADQIKRYHGEAGWRDFARWFGIGTMCAIGGVSVIYLSDYLNWLEGGVNDD